MSAIVIDDTFLDANGSNAVSNGKLFVVYKIDRLTEYQINSESPQLGGCDVWAVRDADKTKIDVIDDDKFGDKYCVIENENGPVLMDRLDGRLFRIYVYNEKLELELVS